MVFSIKPTNRSNSLLRSFGSLAIAINTSADPINFTIKKKPAAGFHLLYYIKEEKKYLKGNKKKYLKENKNKLKLFFFF